MSSSPRPPPAGLPPGAAADTLRIGLIDVDFHRRWPWSAARWAFVGTRLRQVCDQVWCGTAAEMLGALRDAAAVHGVHDAHLHPAFGHLPLQPAQGLVHWPATRCISFSQFWTKATRGLAQAQQLLAQ